MCFQIDYHHSTAKIAENDITCFKILMSGLDAVISPWYSLEYWKIEDCPEFVLMHSTIDEPDCNNDINRGLHSYATEAETQRHDWTGDAYYKAIIPKGSKYYYNSFNHEYVSDTLQVFTAPYVKF